MTIHRIPAFIPLAGRTDDGETRCRRAPFDLWACMTSFGHIVTKEPIRVDDRVIIYELNNDASPSGNEVRGVVDAIVGEPPDQRYMLRNIEIIRTHQ